MTEPTDILIAQLREDLYARLDLLFERITAIERRFDMFSNKLDDLRVDVSACHENDLSLVELLNAHGSTWNDRFAELDLKLDATIAASKSITVRLDTIEQVLSNMNHALALFIQSFTR